MKLKLLNKKNPFPILFKNIFSFFLFPFSFKKTFYFSLKIFFLFSFFFFHFSCSSSTSPQTVTFSGTVTLEDTTDYSGVEVMLFKPVEIDTALTNLNKQYPGVGIEVNQRTEFYWREHTPVYQTTTDASGKWQIKNVEPGTYHIVAKKDGYGWRVLYDSNEKSENKIHLKKAITWQGQYNSLVEIPTESYVRVMGNATLGQGLVVNQGVIIEILNGQQGLKNIDLQINGDLSILGKDHASVFLFSDIAQNNDDMMIINAQKVEVEHLVCRNFANGISIEAAPMVKIKNNRFEQMGVALTINECDSLELSNNVFSRFENSAIKTFSCHLSLTRNIIYDCLNFGLDSKNANNSLLNRNIFKSCRQFATAFNKGGYAYKPEVFITISNNDYMSNENHIFLGYSLYGGINYNNFFHSNAYHIRTHLRTKADTLDCTNNYWGTLNIDQKIYDAHDFNDPNQIGPIINYDPFSLTPIEY